MSGRMMIERDGLRFCFLETGDVSQISCGGVMLNQLVGNALDGSLMNLYLRVRVDGAWRSAPMLGVQSASTCARAESQLVYRGRFEGVSYEVRFSLTDAAFFWDVALSGEGLCDVIWGQDLGLADEVSVLNNPAYMSQYIDYCVFEGAEDGYVITARQNQRMSSGHPALQLGLLEGARAYSTDGFQFFGLDSRVNGEAEALKCDELPSRVYQYEFGYVALQSKPLRLNKAEQRLSFFGRYLPDLPIRNRAEGIPDAVRAAHHPLCAEADLSELARAERLPSEPLSVLPYSAEETAALYGDKVLVEAEDGRELSFFTPEHAHVAHLAKERLLERPHAHIIMTGLNCVTDERAMAATCHMHGAFVSQLVLGNTSFHALNTCVRNPLNRFHSAGLRIWVREGDRFVLLAEPSLFEMGVNYAIWRYKTGSDTLLVRVYSLVEQSEIRLELCSLEGALNRYVITQQLALSESEQGPLLPATREGDTVLYRPHPDTLTHERAPEMVFGVTVSGAAFRLTDDGLFYVDGLARNERLSVLALEPTATFSLTISGSIEGVLPPIEPRAFEAECLRYAAFFSAFTGGFALWGEDARTRRLNATVWWFAHDAMIHFLSPHGIEQSQGAAWGTRDVCQGPVELCLAFGHHSNIRGILMELYAHQYAETGDWPQWFMLGRYADTQQQESHGDIILWPLKVLSDYLSATGDFGILEEELPYTAIADKQFTARREPLLSHVKRQINAIRAQLLPGTALPRYGNGDWDDTLQPADPSLKRQLVSSWTTALTQQVFVELGAALALADGELSASLVRTAADIARDFERLLVKDGVVSGFARFEGDQPPSYMLHPSDDHTHIAYRLIPMTRSIIAQLFDADAANAHLGIICDHLAFPDGVRLMSSPLYYNHGETIHFLRGEQAASFGREVGLCYTHANVRYANALCVLGEGALAMDALERITPVAIHDKVKNALPRQANVHFSSSDGDFATRFDVDYEALRRGEANAKGGWRLYSSGPGIFVHQLICQSLGVRIANGCLVLDPQLPDSMCGQTFTLQIEGTCVEFRYRLTSGCAVRRVLLNGTELPFEPFKNRYRATGAQVKLDALHAGLCTGRQNILELES
ncbi:MAG: hypothetical protein VB115_16525 [Christensenellaceae bacterium]|nr:hypothetical protein [Christensenellaceae bacterium]